MSDTLKPCPFCGGKAVKGICRVFCADCGARPFTGDDIDNEIAAWNRRSSPRLEALEKVNKTRAYFEQRLADHRRNRDKRLYELEEVAYLASLRADLAALDREEKTK